LEHPLGDVGKLVAAARSLARVARVEVPGELAAVVAQHVTVDVLNEGAPRVRGRGRGWGKGRGGEGEGEGEGVGVGVGFRVRVRVRVRVRASPNPHPHPHPKAHIEITKSKQNRRPASTWKLK
jgi:hypothetical protein